jgi:hypothetical protein
MKNEKTENVKRCKVKVMLSLHYHEESRESRGIAPLILNFNTG